MVKKRAAKKAASKKRSAKSARATSDASSGRRAVGLATRDLKASERKDTHQHGLNGNLPSDCPVLMELHELTKGNKRTGWTLEMDVIPVGRTFYLRLGMDGTVRMFVKEEGGTFCIYTGERGDEADVWEKVRRKARRKR